MPSHKPFERQQRQDPHFGTLAEGRAGLRFEAYDLTGYVLDPNETSGARKLHFVGALGNAGIECSREFLRQRGAVDDEAHFGIDLGRPWIKVEGADKKARAIDGKGLGVETGARATVHIRRVIWCGER